MEGHWNACVHEAGRQCLMQYLEAHVPRAHWATARDEYGTTLLHVASGGGDVHATHALLRLGIIHVDTTTCFGSTPAHAAVGSVGTLELLCAAGAGLASRAFGLTPLDTALWKAQEPFPRYLDCIRLLIANGVRLSTVSPKVRHVIEPWMVALERGRLRCRAAVVALLSAKRRGAAYVCKLDRWMVREMGFAIFATRQGAAWQ